MKLAMLSVERIVLGFVFAAMISCNASTQSTQERNNAIVAYYEAYFGDIDEYRVDSLSLLPISRTSEGAAFNEYQNTGEVSIREIEEFGGTGMVRSRLLSANGYPDLLAVRRTHWNPATLPDELTIIFDETSLFIANDDEWIEHSNDASIPIEQIPDLIEFLTEAVELAEAQS